MDDLSAMPESMTKQMDNGVMIQVVADSSELRSQR